MQDHSLKLPMQCTSWRWGNLVLEAEPGYTPGGSMGAVEKCAVVKTERVAGPDKSLTRRALSGWNLSGQVGIAQLSKGGGFLKHRLEPSTIPLSSSMNESLSFLRVYRV
jgi:hypothetical protein